MSLGQGNITLTDPQGAPPGFINVAGARNGLSVDPQSFIVLGQTIAAAGDPAQLLSNREIPLETFWINWRGSGGVSMSDNPLAVPAGTKLFLQDNIAAGILLQADLNPGAGNPGFWAELTLGGVLGINMFCDDGQTSSISLFNMSSLDEVVEFAAIEVVGVAGPGLIENLNGISPNHAVTGGSCMISAYEDLSTMANTGGTNKWISFNSIPTIELATANDTVIGFIFQPNVVSATAKYVAFENTVGNVLLCTLGSSAAGRVGVRQVTTPTAWLHIGAGAAAASSAPLKLTAGTLLTTPETGAFEFDGTHLYFTIGATRNTII